MRGIVIFFLFWGRCQLGLEKVLWSYRPAGRLGSPWLLGAGSFGALPSVLSCLVPVIVVSVVVPVVDALHTQRRSRRDSN